MTETHFDSSETALEFYKLPPKPNVLISLIMMVKNESSTILNSLNSAFKFVDAITIFDTGSDDRTVEIIKDFCKQKQKNLYLKQGEFVDFSTSRNDLFIFAEKIDTSFLLLLDGNDELKGGDHLDQFLKSQKDTNFGMYLLRQEWKNHGSIETYFNTRLLRNNCGCRYKGKVHEYVEQEEKFRKDSKGKDIPVFRVPNEICLFQDRTADQKDIEKSRKRFSKDYVILKSDYSRELKEKGNPDPRTCFYLAQTCGDLGKLDEAYYYYQVRTTLEGFWEEIFHAYLRMGNISKNLGHSWPDSMKLYLQAFEHTKRVEPIIHIMEHYITKKDWEMGYYFGKIAKSLNFPDHCILFVDKFPYEYKRWHLSSMTDYYTRHIDEGKEACIRAIDYVDKHPLFPDREVDKNNLKTFYNMNLNLVKDDKKGFIDFQIKKLREENPRGNEEQFLRKAELLWKLSKIPPKVVEVKKEEKKGKKK